VCEPVQRQHPVILPVALVMSACANSPAAKSGPAGLFCPPLRHCSTNPIPCNVLFILFFPFVQAVTRMLHPVNPSLLSNEGTVLVARFIIAHQPMKKYDTVFL
jgi:hypothetical protein